MIEIVNVPITYKPNEMNEETFSTRQITTTKRLSSLLNRGYEIISQHKVETRTGSHTNFILYRRPRNKKNSVTHTVEDQSHAA